MCSLGCIFSCRISQAFMFVYINDISYPLYLQVKFFLTQVVGLYDILNCINVFKLNMREITDVILTGKMCFISVICSMVLYSYLPKAVLNTLRKITK